VRLPGLRRVGLGGWSEDPVWASIYPWLVAHPRVGRPVWAVGLRSDLDRLYAATQEISRLPAGSAVLDVPCGGGVGLRGLRPGQGLRYVAADIAPEMLKRTMAAAYAREVEDQVETHLADVADLPFDDETFDLVASFTGLHCFPDPARGVVEMMRVLGAGGVFTGSALLNDSGLQHAPLRRVGRLTGLIGPGCTSDDVQLWLHAQGGTDVTLEWSGAMAYFRAVKG
jgi:SAM-dependent methyltransferase